MIDLKSIFNRPPQFNEQIIYSVMTDLSNKPTEYKYIDKWVKSSPETLAIIGALVTDLLGDNFYFEGGKQAVNKAKKFVDDNFFKEELKKVLWDWFVYGDGYLWKGKVDGYSSDEDILHFVRHVPSTTMNIFLNNEKTEIAVFKQMVDGEVARSWNPDEIIHGKLITIGGKLYGWSPLTASLTEIQTISFVKDYASNFFKNGGTPDFIFSLAKETAGSPNHKYLEQMLSKYKPMTGKHGNLTLCGEVGIERVNDFKKDMEFRQLAIYLTGVLALAYGLPVSRLAAILGTEVKVSSGADDLADAAYWRSVSDKQDYWETLLNTQLFKPYFDVDIRFNRGYKQDEVREVQILMQKIDAITKMNDEFGRYEIHLSEDYVKKLFKLDDADLKEGKLEPSRPNGLARQGMMSNQKLLGGPAKQKLSDEKRKQVSPTQDTSGL